MPSVTNAQHDSPPNKQKPQQLNPSVIRASVAATSNESWKYAPAGTVAVRDLTLPEKDEEARQQAPQQQGYCVDELCACDKHQCVPPRRTTPFEGQTTYRTEYTAKLNPDEMLQARYAGYGPDGVPIGVDPKVWQEYIKKNGVPPLDRIPAHLYYKQTADNRDFATEHRTQYTPKDIGFHRNMGAELWGPDGVPIGVDPTAWKEYIAKHGIPPLGRIPAHLYYKSAPDTRDFATDYRTSYVPYTVSVCPLLKLPQYPSPNWPRQHTFWDPVTKVWY